MYRADKKYVNIANIQKYDNINFMTQYSELNPERFQAAIRPEATIAIEGITQSIRWRQRIMRRLLAGGAVFGVLAATVSDGHPLLTTAAVGVGTVAASAAGVRERIRTQNECAGHVLGFTTRIGGDYSDAHYETSLSAGALHEGRSFRPGTHADGHWGTGFLVGMGVPGSALVTASLCGESAAEGRAGIMTGAALVASAIVGVLADKLLGRQNRGAYGEQLKGIAEPAVSFRQP